jgi:acetolactate synthase-1/2/3 large subunit
MAWLEAEKRMKLSVWLARKVAELGIRDVFCVTGGGAMHLNHAFGTHPDLTCLFNHHEQACAMAADAYFRLSNKPALVNVTSGPGGTNAITGVYGAYVDSLGMIVISGQVKRETTVRSTGLPLRQYGDQELDIEPIVTPITKYCAMVNDPRTIRYHIEKAYYLATTGRPGPVWLDIPLDVQGAQIDPETLVGFDPAELEESWKTTDLAAAAETIFAEIAKAKRPVVFVGAGVRLSGRHADFLALIEKLGVPVVTGWNAHDALWNAHPLYCGRPGTIGDRAGNFTVQNADLLLVLGSRLNIRQVSYNWASFARRAKKIWIDIDAAELQKPSVKADVAIHADLRDLLPVLASRPGSGPTEGHREWLSWARARGAAYPTVLPDYWRNEKVNPYCFVQALFAEMPDDQIVVSANGSACVIGFQAADIAKGQRFWTNSGCASMGYDLPAAIGAHQASGKSVVCLAGDGSIMMNLQELQTIAGAALPIKIFVLNNSGYVSIFQTQRNFFNGEEVGAGPKSGVTLPDFGRLAAAFGLPFSRIESHDNMARAIRDALAVEGPVVCEIMLDENQPFAPKLSSRQLPDGTIVSPDLEDLAPFLPREEFARNMIED